MPNATSPRATSELRARARSAPAGQTHGHDTTDAENLLRAMETARAAMGAHREHIVRELSRASDEQRAARP
jgi:hypothetical protein